MLGKLLNHRLNPCKKERYNAIFVVDRAEYRYERSFHFLLAVLSRGCEPLLPKHVQDLDLTSFASMWERNPLGRIAIVLKHSREGNPDEIVECRRSYARDRCAEY